MARSAHFIALDRRLKMGKQTRVRRALGLSLAVFLVLSCGILSNPTQPAPTATVTTVPSATPTNTAEPTATLIPPTLTASAIPPSPAPSAPSAPVNLEVIGTSCTVDKSVDPAKFVNQFHLYWQDLANNEDGFRVYRDGDLIAELLPDETDLIDEVVSPNNNPHFYYIIAYNEMGEAKSEFVSIQCTESGGGGYTP
jgi:hypothetical protein